MKRIRRIGKRRPKLTLYTYARDHGLKGSRTNFDHVIEANLRGAYQKEKERLLAPFLDRILNGAYTGDDIYRVSLLTEDGLITREMP